MEDTIRQIGATIGWSALGLAILYVGIWTFDRVDPIDYREEIRAGNIAAGIKMAAVTLSLALIIVIGIGI